MGIRQWIVAVLVGIALFTIAAVVTVTVFLDANDLKRPLENTVTRATGKPLTLEGDLKVTTFPWLGVQTGAAQLGNPPIVQWKSARISAKVAPLLGGSVLFDRIDIEGLTARFGKNDENQVHLPHVELEVSPFKPGQAMDLNLKVSNGGSAATHLKGTVHPPKEGEPQIWRVTLHGDRVDLAHYLTLGEGAEEDEPFELPVDALKDLPVQGSLTFKEFKYATAQLKDVRLQLEATADVR